MKKLIIFLGLVFSIGIYAQHGNSTWTYDLITPIGNDTLLVWNDDTTRVMTASSLQVGANNVDYSGDYFVATWGSDANDGSYTSPWKTWHYAFNQLSAGDTLYIRGGVYYPVGVSAIDQTMGVYVDDIDGTATDRICVFGYPRETPILDGSQIVHVEEYTVGVFIADSEYWHFKGLNIRRFAQESGESAGAGIWTDVVGNTIYENMACYENGGPGFRHSGDAEGTSTPNNEWINCDGYDNNDPYTAIPGDHADGFSIGFNRNLTDTFRVVGCRAWGNADDGLDFFDTEGVVLVHDTWSFNNGSTPPGYVFGIGFKLGASDSAATSTYIREIYNCIASGNNAAGLTENQLIGLVKVVNFTSYNNREWSMKWDGAADVASVYRNIIAYKGGIGDYNGPHAVKTHDHNSYEFTRAPDGITVTDADFLSLDTMQLYRSRKSDGSLPDIDFLKLDPHSKFVGAGIDVGFPFPGHAPDVGATNNTSLSIIRNDPYTATASADLNGTHLISAGSKAVTITSVDANRWVFLPYASASTVGTIINGAVGSNGFELRAYFDQLTTVYINNVTTNVEAAIPANHSFEAKQIDATHWILRAWTNLGAEITPIEPDAI